MLNKKTLGVFKLKRFVLIVLTLSIIISKNIFSQNNEYTGNWNTNWGELNFKQNGNIVSGKFKYQDTRVTGKIVDNRLVVKWYQKNGIKGTGYFLISLDLKIITGRWVNSDGILSGNWFGVKTTNSE